MKKQKITKQKLFLCCISCLLFYLRYIILLLLLHIYLLYLEYLFYAAGIWAPKTPWIKYDQYFSTEKIISEQIPTKSNPTSGFEPAFKKYHFKCNLTFCKISAQNYFRNSHSRTLAKISENKAFQKCPANFSFSFSMDFPLEKKNHRRFLNFALKNKYSFLKKEQKTRQIVK